MLLSCCGCCHVINVDVVVDVSIHFLVMKGMASRQMWPHHHVLGALFGNGVGCGLIRFTFLFLVSWVLLFLCCFRVPLVSATGPSSFSDDDDNFFLGSEQALASR